MSSLDGIHSIMYSIWKRMSRCWQSDPRSRMFSSCCPNGSKCHPFALWKFVTLECCDNDRDGVSNHRRLHCLLKCWFRCRSKETPKLHVTGLCVGNSPVIGEFPAQRASNTEMFPFDDSFGSADGLWPEGIKLLSEPMLMWHLWVIVTLTQVIIKNAFLNI